MNCDKCGICCIGCSIRSTLPDGSVFEKEAGVRCTYLSSSNLCSVWGNISLQPEVCRTIRPSADLCRPDLRSKPHRHLRYLIRLDLLTRPED
jgi:hypothetical protein